MAGFNLFTWQTEFRSAVFNKNLDPRSVAAVNDSEINSRIREALMAMQAELGIQLSQTSTTPVATGVFRYPLPIDRLGTNIDAVTVIEGGGSFSPQHPLRYLPVSEFNLRYNPATTANDSGSPFNWTFDPESSGNSKILIRPVPSFTGTIIYTYTSTAQQMWQVFNPGTEAQADVVQGSTSVLLSGSPAPWGTDPTGQQFITAGNEFGIITTTQQDGQTARNPVPDVWYGIESWTGVLAAIRLTLTSPVVQMTGDGFKFVTAQVPTLVGVAPDIMANTPAYWAASIYCQNLGQDAKAEKLMARAQAGLERCRPVRPPMKTYRDFSFITQWDGPYQVQYGGGTNNV